MGNCKPPQLPNQYLGRAEHDSESTYVRSTDKPVSEAEQEMHFWVICINMNGPYMCIQITYKSARALGNVVDPV